MQIHIYNTAWESYPYVSQNQVATVAIFCAVHAQANERALSI